MCETGLPKEEIESIQYRVYWYSDKILKPAWVRAETLDSLEEAKEYAARRMNDDWIQKTVIVKETTTQKREVLKDTLNEKQ